MFDARAARDRGKHPVLVRLPIGRNQATDRLPTHLVGSVAEQSLRSFIPTCDQTVERLAVAALLPRSLAV
jgi:hypothetical protein